MSNSLAIAAVSATLRSLLERGLWMAPDLEDTRVTTLAPDRARGNLTINQLNLFLYQAVPNAALHNIDMPRQVRPGETGHPPLPLTLFYLITAYGRDNDEVFAHRVLGRAMSILHDYPLLGADEIRAALPLSDLADQVERVRITPQPLSLEEMSKLWTTFQTQYRVSAAYQVSVVLIESTREAKTPLPVLTIGVGDSGPVVQPDLVPPFATLEQACPPSQRTSALLGDTLTLRGHHLAGDQVLVRFANPNLSDTEPRPTLEPRTANEVKVTIPDDSVKWPAGLYTVAVIAKQAGQDDRVTNELPLTLAPKITGIAPANPVRDANRNVTLTVICEPQVRPNQRASLLLGDRQVRAVPPGAPTDTLEFFIEGAPVGSFFVRLRVDGVDSPLIDRTVTPPVFDPAMRITIS